MDSSAPAPTGPRQSRLVGRSRPYTAANLSARLRHWHAPRVNRWERLCVETGQLTLEYLHASDTTRTTLAAGARHWFGPGVRWRVIDMPAECAFILEVHADDRGQARNPHPLRSQVLTQTRRQRVADPAALRASVAALPINTRQLLDGAFALPAWTELPKGEGQLFWHPLQAGPAGFSVLIARSAEPFDLTAYLGRDHAVIEAALGRALTGDAEGKAWLLATLARHLAIEEELLFPAWLAAGGTRAHVDGLLHEHAFLREHLQAFDDADHRRKLLRLLDAHDEKEEQVIYPDIVTRLGPQAPVLLQQAIAQPLP